MPLSSCDTDSLLAILERVAVADVITLGSTCKVLHTLTSDDIFWRGLALRKWGARVLELRATAEEGTWKAYAIKRMNLRTIRASPLQLGQERFPDPWQHIICCVLCSRTSGSNIIRDTINRFFDILPTPSAVLDAADDTITDLIHPLGLQPVRLRAVRSVSEGFLGTDWEDPTVFYGCGRFVADSWRIFCRGDLSGAGVEDRNLKAYVAWAKREARAAAGGDAATSDAASEGAVDDVIGLREGEERPRQRSSVAAEASGRGERAARRARRETAMAVAAPAPRRQTRSGGTVPAAGATRKQGRGGDQRADEGTTVRTRHVSKAAVNKSADQQDASSGRDQGAACQSGKRRKEVGSGRKPPSQKRQRIVKRNQGAMAAAQ